MSCSIIRTFASAIMDQSVTECVWENQLKNSLLNSPNGSYHQCIASWRMKTLAKQKFTCSEVPGQLKTGVKSHGNAGASRLCRTGDQKVRYPSISVEREIKTRISRVKHSEEASLRAPGSNLVQLNWAKLLALSSTLNTNILIHYKSGLLSCYILYRR